MNGQERRNAIIERLKGSTAPISANILADEHAVTRQITVADIALLRAAGHHITAVSRGYVLEPSDDGLTKYIAVKHDADQIADEFYAVVDNGGRVLNIQVEHTLYGRISAELNITSRYEADQFVLRSKETGATPLALLTDGIHIHAIAVKDEESFTRIVQKLSELGMLVEAN